MPANIPGRNNSKEGSSENLLEPALKRQKLTDEKPDQPLQFSLGPSHNPSPALGPKQIVDEKDKSHSKVIENLITNVVSL